MQKKYIQPAEFDLKQQYGWFLEVDSTWVKEMTEAERTTINRIVRNHMERCVPKAHRKHVKYIFLEQDDVCVFAWKYSQSHPVMSPVFLDLDQYKWGQTPK